MHRVTSWFAVFALSSNVAAAAPLPPDAYQIFAHARAVWLSQRYPDMVSYRIAVVVDDRGVTKTNHYRAIYDALHDSVRVDAVSLEEHANPHTPEGVNLSIRPKRNFQTILVKPVGNPESAVDFLGVPHLSPNYSFGISPYVAAAPNSQDDAAARAALVRAIRQQYNDPMSEKKTEDLSSHDGLKEIASVATPNRNYVVTYGGMETLAGRDTYHLLLRPVHTSVHLRLRELWVDTQTFATPQLITQGNFNRLGDVPWTVTFQDVGGSQYIASETANAPVSLGPHTYDRAKIAFEEIAPAQSAPTSFQPFTPETNTLEEPP